ncbi:MAG: citrate lyase subunit beta/citryl-CoA lyase [Flavobacteriales bacterium]|jgi:citrate lyase subunit beta/citryl-CoA lyase
MKTQNQLSLDVTFVYETLINNGVAIVPSKLGYGIMAITRKGVDKLYKLKNRPMNKPTGILATPLIFKELTDSKYSNDVQKVGYPIGFIEKPIANHSVLDKLPNYVDQNGTISFFMNMDSFMTKLARYAWERGDLVVISSCNKSGEGNVLNFDDLHLDFKESADFYFQKDDLSILGERSALDAITSTMINLTTNKITRLGLYAERTRAIAWENNLINEVNEILKKSASKNTQFASCMYMLAFKESTYDRIKHSQEIDWLVLDLEDGCPAEEKQNARELIEKHAKLDTFSNHQVAVRLNELSNINDLRKDLAISYTRNIKGFALPMLNCAEDVKEYDRMITEIEEWLNIPKHSFKFFPIIETVEGLNNAVSIAKASSRNVAMFLGHADLFSQTFTERTIENLHGVRSTYLWAAKEARIAAFDTPYENVKDLTGLEKDAKAAKSLGLDGKVALSFDQVNTINRIFRIPRTRKEQIKTVLSKYKGGCEIIDGQFIAPPIVKKLKQELLKGVYKPVKAKPYSVRGKIISYGLDYKNAYPGLVVPSPYETTVDESWITGWQGMVQTGNPLETSLEFCLELGLEKRLIPFECLINLGLCLAVESFSESSLFHLGISNVIYEKPAYVGDTIRSVMILDEISPASSKKYAVFKTRMVLLNQRNERVVSMNRNSLFPYIKHEDIPAYKIDKSSPFLKYFAGEKTYLRDVILEKARRSSLAILDDVSPFKKGDLILHSITRPMGLSNSLLYSTLYKNTHPLHINSARYGMDGLVVCGGFVIPLIHASASRDIRFALDHEIVDTMHINKIHHEDSVGAMSYILDSVIEDGIECLTIRTFGLKNVDAEKELFKLDIPIELLASPKIKPSEIELLCKVYCPELQQKICARLTWKMWRKA